MRLLISTLVLVAAFALTTAAQSQETTEKKSKTKSSKFCEVPETVTQPGTTSGETAGALTEDNKESGKTEVVVVKETVKSDKKETKKKSGGSCCSSDGSRLKEE